MGRNNFSENVRTNATVGHESCASVIDEIRNRGRGGESLRGRGSSSIIGTGEGRGSSKGGMVGRNHTRRTEPPADRELLQGVYITSRNEITDWSLNAMCLSSVYLEWGRDWKAGCGDQSLEDQAGGGMKRGALE